MHKNREDTKGKRKKRNGLGKVLDETKAQEVAREVGVGPYRIEGRRGFGPLTQEPPRTMRRPRFPPFISNQAEPSVGAPL